MNLAPACQQIRLLRHNHLHRVAHIAPLHALYGHHLRHTARPDQIELGVPVSKNMDMCRFMIIGKDDEAQAMSAQNSDRRGE